MLTTVAPFFAGIGLLFCGGLAAGNFVGRHAGRADESPAPFSWRNNTARIVAAVNPWLAAPLNKGRAV